MKKKLDEIIEELDNNTNLYPIYPDIDEPIAPEIMESEEVEEEEIIQQTDLINPDPNLLDRG